MPRSDEDLLFLADLAAARAEIAEELHGPRGFDRKRAVEIVQEQARQVLPEPAATDWLYAENERLRGNKPIDAAMLRGADDVIDALEAEWLGNE